jgi:hypothetical protein
MHSRDSDGDLQRRRRAVRGIKDEDQGRGAWPTLKGDIFVMKTVLIERYQPRKTT